MDESSELLAYDREHIWPPYGKLPNDDPRYCVAAAQGVHITLQDGRRLVDGMSSWWSTLLGYRHPDLMQAAHTQLDTLPHVMFGGLTHTPAIELARALLRCVPAGLEQVFYCDSGSVSVEVALKMARQCYLARPHTDSSAQANPQVLSLRGGYHGDTWGALSVCDPELSLHGTYGDALQPALFAPRPCVPFGQSASAEQLATVTDLIHQHAQRLCAVIIEPVAQGAGGMHFYSADYLRAIRHACDETGVLLIADEIATGFGRTGKLFACDHANITPDILCLGKALTGGTLSFAATLTTRAVGDALASSPPGCFLHGPTFMGNPLACAIALRTLQVLDKLDTSTRVAQIEDQLRTGLAPCHQSSAVKDVRVLGAIGVVEMHEPLDLSKVTPRLVDRGVWLRPFGRLLYTMPPYIIDESSLAQVTSAMCQIAEQPAT